MPEERTASGRRAPAAVRFPDGTPSLAEAKLLAPRRRQGLVARSRLLERLDRIDGAALTLVAAPAGYGKTTAVREWCEAREVTVAWVTLDVADNDPVRLWRYVATAVDGIREGLGRSALQRLNVPGSPIESAIDELMRGVASLGRELVVVLDDLQTVTSKDSLASVAYCLERLPASLRVIALTRSDPSLGLARLRARGALVEIRADELAFTDAEAHELLMDQRGLALEPAEVAVLRERTDGWPAALYLAALWLQSSDDPHEAIRAFGGDHRFVVDYLTHEVINALDDDMRTFLLHICVLGKFTATLCDAVLGRTDSAAKLEELECSNLFVARLAHGGWHRVHPLFAEFARFQLAAVDPEAATRIHQAAATWLNGRRRPVEAAEHAAAAGDHELLAELLSEHHLALLRGGNARTLLDFVHLLPDAEIIARPELAAGAATATTLVGGAALERRRFLDLVGRAEIEWPERITPYVEATRSMVRAASVDTDVAHAVREGRFAVRAAAAGGDDALVAAKGGLARALYFAGELDEAGRVALEAVAHPDADRRPTGQAFARSTLALVAVEGNRLGIARRHAEKARSLVGGVGFSRSWLGANASVAIGAVLEAEGDFAGAEHELVHADRFFEDELATVHHAWLLVLLARLRVKRGRLEDAEATLRAARAEIRELTDPGRIVALAAEVERALDTAQARARSGEVVDQPSDAELAVLRLLATELTSREIAERLFLSPNTVRSHTRVLYRKLSVNSRADAVARAALLGLLDEAQSPM